MKIHIQKYVVLTENSLADALAKLDEGGKRTLFVIDGRGELKGSLSDGDIRRWLSKRGEGVDLSTSVMVVMNPSFSFIKNTQPRSTANVLFKNGVSCIPVVDNQNHLIDIIMKDDAPLSIDGYEISRNSSSYIIAEIGNNHQGSLVEAKRLIDAAVLAGANCAKFQMRSPEALYRTLKGSEAEDLSVEYTQDLLNKFSLPDSELFAAFDYCQSRGITPLCTPWDDESLGKLEMFGLTAYKVASADLTNHFLLKKLAETGKPLICSTGMSTETEIIEAVGVLDSLGVSYALLHCNSTYPTPDKDINLRYLKRLGEISRRLVGYSGHERGTHVPVASIVLGAKIIEKHLTLDRAQEGADHKVSLLPGEFKQMVDNIRSLESALGKESMERTLSQGELLNRENLAKSLVASRDIVKGEIITEDMLEVRSPGRGIQPNRLADIVGKTAKREILRHDFFYESDIKTSVEHEGRYSFSRPFGVPVRYHDFNMLVNRAQLDFVEFHLSYADIGRLDPSALTYNQELSFAVHAPELFENDHLLDLASTDPKYRQRSVDYLLRTIEEVSLLNELFPKTENPTLITNVGGWSKAGFLSADEKSKRYEIFLNTINSIDLSCVTFAVQTMPPYPWHLGGQSFHNLFVDPLDIDAVCSSDPRLNMCLDISHSSMACSKYGWDLSEFIQKIGPHTVHLHISDARGLDGEGVEIGTGDIDFRQLMGVLDRECPNVPFVPEIWQGHKDFGSGFWTALRYLEDVSR